MLNTRRKTTVVQVAPAVRTAWAEAFKLSRKFASPERLAGALRLMGFDYVFDTTYAADLTIMEEPVANVYLLLSWLGSFLKIPVS